MYLLIVAGGTFFVLKVPGENMDDKKDSLGREFLAANNVNSNDIFCSLYNFPSSSGKLITTFLYPEASTNRTTLKFEADFKNEVKSE